MKYNPGPINMSRFLKRFGTICERFNWLSMSTAPSLWKNGKTDFGVTLHRNTKSYCGLTLQRYILSSQTVKRLLKFELMYIAAS